MFLLFVDNWLYFNNFQYFCIFIYLSLTFMVVVDVAGYQAMWLASRCNDLYIKRARPLLQVYHPTTPKVLERLLWSAGLWCIVQPVWNVPSTPGHNLSPAAAHRRKSGKRDVHTLQYPCPLTGQDNISWQQFDEYVIQMWLHLKTVTFSFFRPQVNDKQVGQEWFLT